METPGKGIAIHLQWLELRQICNSAHFFAQRNIAFDDQNKLRRMLNGHRRNVWAPNWN